MDPYPMIMQVKEYPKINVHESAQHIESTSFIPTIPIFKIIQEKVQEVSDSQAEKQNVLTNEEKNVQVLVQQNEANEGNANVKTKEEKNEKNHND